MTEGSRRFARALFSRNFTCAKFRENKTLAKIFEFTLVFGGYGYYSKHCFLSGWLARTRTCTVLKNVSKAYRGYPDQTASSAV